MWYLGITSAIFAACRSLLPTDTTKQRNETADTYLNRMCAHTHSYPITWQGHEKSSIVYQEVDFLLQHQLKIFIFEVTGVFLTPFILLFSLPKTVPDLVEFLTNHSRFIPGIGVVCDYSLFEFAKYGDCSYCSPDTQIPQNNPNTQNNNLDPKTTQKSEVLNFGKLEKSFLNFKQTYPNLDHTQLQLVPLSQDENVAVSGFMNRFGLFKELKKEMKMQGLKSILEMSEVELPPPTIAAVDSPEEKQGEQQAQQTQEGDMIKSTYLHPPSHSHPPSSFPPPFPLHMQRSTSSQSSHLNFNNTSASELPQILLSVLREQNIDYQNDFYWLARFHAEKQRQPRELEQSMLLFRERSMMRSQIPQRQPSPGSGGGVYYPSATQPRYDLDMKMISPESPGGLGLHLSGVTGGIGGLLGPQGGAGQGQQINNGFLPPPWSPPSSSQRYRPPQPPLQGQQQQGQQQGQQGLPRRQNDV